MGERPVTSEQTHIVDDTPEYPLFAPLIPIARIYNKKNAKAAAKAATVSQTQATEVSLDIPDLEITNAICFWRSYCLCWTVWTGKYTEILRKMSLQI